MNWRDESQCRDVDDKDRFFAARGRQSRDVQAGCKGCPVSSQCLDFAVASPWLPYGVWGGLPGKQVRDLWRTQHHDPADDVVGLRSRSIT